MRNHLLTIAIMLATVGGLAFFIWLMTISGGIAVLVLLVVILYIGIFDAVRRRL